MDLGRGLVIWTPDVWKKFPGDFARLERFSISGRLNYRIANCFLALESQQKECGMTRLSLFLLITYFLKVSPSEAQGNEEAKPRITRATDAINLVERARSLPPEFAAKAFLRLIRTPLIADSKWKIELIEEAFQSGGKAQMPFRYEVIGLSADSRTRLEFSANDLEALSIQIEAVEAMLQLDKGRASKLFESISIQEIPTRTCQDANIPNLSAYYGMAEKIFETTFTAKQRKEEDDIRFLENVVLTIRSPSQVESALNIVLTTNLTKSQRSFLLSKFAAILDGMGGDDRTFGATQATLIPDALPALAETIVIIPALRSYVVRQLRGPRCHDNIAPLGQLPLVARNFNGFIARIDKEGTTYRAIAETEIKSVKDEGTFKSEFAWRSSRGKEVLGALQWLTHGNRSGQGKTQAWTLDERKMEQWQDRYDSTLKLIEGWKESEEESPEDYTFVISITYKTLATLAIGEAARNRAIDSYLRFLEQRYTSTNSRNLWFASVRMMFDKVSASKDEVEQRWLISHFTRSANPVISVYTDIEQQLIKH